MRNCVFCVCGNCIPFDQFFFVKWWVSFFFNCIIPLEFSPWEIQVTFPRESQLQQSRPTQPTVHAVFNFKCFHNFHNPPNSDMDYRTFNMCRSVNAYDCTCRYMDTVRESVLTADSGKQILFHTKESNVRQRHAGLMFYQLSYIPTTKGAF